MSPLAHRRKIRSQTLDGLSAVSVLGGTVDRGSRPPAAGPASDFIFGVNATDIQGLPTSGTGAWGQNLATAWNNLLTQTSGTINTIPPPAQQDRSQFIVVANALAYVKYRDSDPATAQPYYDKAAAACAAIAGDSAQAVPTTGWLIYSTPDAILWGHHIQAYILAADLLNYRTPDMLAFADKCRTKVIGSSGGADTIEKYARSIAHSRGCHHRANYIACCLFLGETLPSWLIQCAKAFFGDNSAGWHTFADSNYHSDGISGNGCDLSTNGGSFGAVNVTDQWWPCNTNADPKKNNLLIPMVIRQDSNNNTSYSEWPSGQPKWGDSYIGTSASPASGYFMTQMNGTMFWMLMLEKNGYPNIWTTDTNNGPLRMFQQIWNYRDNWHSPSQPYAFVSFNAWVDCMIEVKYPGALDRTYGTAQTAPNACGGSQAAFGCTDWLASIL